MLDPGKRDRTLSTADRIVYFMLPLLCVGVQPADAARALRESEAEVVNFAFATQLGSGVYSVGGRTIQIYRLPVAWTIREPGDHSPSIRLRLPITFGIYDFAARDVVESGLPDHLDTFSAAGGIEFDFPLANGWQLVPYAEAGRAWDRSGDGDATLYAASLHARREWPAAERLQRFQVGIIYAGVDLTGSAGTSDMVKVETGFETRRPLDFRYGGAPADGGVSARRVVSGPARRTGGGLGRRQSAAAAARGRLHHRWPVAGEDLEAAAAARRPRLPLRRRGFGLSPGIRRRFLTRHGAGGLIRLRQPPLEDLAPPPE